MLRQQGNKSFKPTNVTGRFLGRIPRSGLSALGKGSVYFFATFKYLSHFIARFDVATSEPLFLSTVAYRIKSSRAQSCVPRPQNRDVDNCRR